MVHRLTPHQVDSCFATHLPDTNMDLMERKLLRFDHGTAVMTV